LTQDSDNLLDLTKSLGSPYGSYTHGPEEWAAGKHTEEEEKLFALRIRRRLDDKATFGCRSQAAYYLRLAPRSALRNRRSQRCGSRLRTRGLKDRPAIEVKEAWTIQRSG